MLNNLKFIDYFVLMRKLTDRQHQMILQLHKESQKVDIQMNIKKINMMFTN